MNHRQRMFPAYKANRIGAKYKLVTINVHIGKTDTIVVSPQPSDGNGVYQDLGMRFAMGLKEYTEARLICCVKRFCHRYRVKSRQIQVYSDLEIGTRPNVILFRKEWLQ
jgi:hypothetical protein